MMRLIDTPLDLERELLATDPFPTSFTQLEVNVRNGINHPEVKGVDLAKVINRFRESLEHLKLRCNFQSEDNASECLAKALQECFKLKHIVSRSVRPFNIQSEEDMKAMAKAFAHLLRLETIYIKFSDYPGHLILKPLLLKPDHSVRKIFVFDGTSRHSVVPKEWIKQHVQLIEACRPSSTLQELIIESDFHDQSVTDALIQLVEHSSSLQSVTIQTLRVVDDSIPLNWKNLAEGLKHNRSLREFKFSVFYNDWGDTEYKAEAEPIRYTMDRNFALEDLVIYPWMPYRIDESVLREWWKSNPIISNSTLLESFCCCLLIGLGVAKCWDHLRSQQQLIGLTSLLSRIMYRVSSTCYRRTLACVK
jgi:hypothetical protein